MSGAFNPEKFGEQIHAMTNHAHDLLEECTEMNPDLPPEVLLAEIMDRSSTAILADLMRASDDNYEEARDALQRFLGVSMITRQIAQHLVAIAEDLKH